MNPSPEAEQKPPPKVQFQLDWDQMDHLHVLCLAQDQEPQEVLAGLVDAAYYHYCSSRKSTVISAGPEVTSMGPGGYKTDVTFNNPETHPQRGAATMQVKRVRTK